MNKFNNLILLVLIVITGCKSTGISNNNLSQVIDDFDMNIYSNEGEKLFSIKSPSSSFENNNILNLKETVIHLFKNNETEYIINSDESRVKNNMLLELNGNVFVKSSISKGDKLYANSFIWDISKSEYVLTGNVELDNNNITLTSNKAILNNNNKIIEFFNPVEYIIKDNNEEIVYEIKSDNAFYDINTKAVSFESKEERVRSKLYF